MRITIGELKGLIRESWLDPIKVKPGDRVSGAAGHKSSLYGHCMRSTINGQCDPGMNMYKKYGTVLKVKGKYAQVERDDGAVGWIERGFLDTEADARKAHAKRTVLKKKVASASQGTKALNVTLEPRRKAVTAVKDTMKVSRDRAMTIVDSVMSKVDPDMAPNAYAMKFAIRKGEIVAYARNVPVASLNMKTGNWKRLKF
jgi:hypothetical protein